MSIHVRILLFAALARDLGQREMALALPDNATVDAALHELSRRHPSVAAMRDKLATAVRMSYVKGDHRLGDGDELALIPPVSGG